MNYLENIASIFTISVFIAFAIAVIAFFFKTIANVISSRVQFSIALSLTKYTYFLLKADAKKYRRSLTKQIEFLLESYYDNQLKEAPQNPKYAAGGDMDRL